MEKGTSGLNDFAPIRVKKELLLWLKVESSKRGQYLYEWLEQVLAKGMDGKRPWRDMIKEGDNQ